MNRIEAIRIFNLVLETVRRYEAEMTAAKACPMNFDEGHGGGVGKVGSYKPEYVAWFALAGKKALMGGAEGCAVLAYRLEHGWSVGQLAARAGVDPRQVRQAENGQDVKLSSARLIAQVLGKTVDDLFSGEVDDGCFSRIAYTVFYEYYVKNRSEAEAMSKANISKQTFRWYLDEIAVRVAPVLQTHGLYTQQLKGEMVEQDLEAMGRR